MIRFGGILGRRFKRQPGCPRPTCHARHHRIGSACVPSGVGIVMHPSSTLKYSHARRRQSRSAFWSSRTALRLVSSHRERSKRQRSPERSCGSFIGMLATVYALFARAVTAIFAEHDLSHGREISKGRRGVKARRTSRDRGFAGIIDSPSRPLDFTPRVDCGSSGRVTGPRPRH